MRVSKHAYRPRALVVLNTTHRDGDVILKIFFLTYILNIRIYEKIYEKIFSYIVFVLYDTNFIYTKFVLRIANTNDYQKTLDYQNKKMLNNTSCA